jgi:hypothetical protein
MVYFVGGAYGSLPDAAIWWCLRTGGGGVLTSFYSFLGLLKFKIHFNFFLLGTVCESDSQECEGK